MTVETANLDSYDFEGPKSSVDQAINMFSELGEESKSNIQKILDFDTKIDGIEAEGEECLPGMQIDGLAAELEDVEEDRSSELTELTPRENKIYWGMKGFGEYF